MKRIIALILTFLMCFQFICIPEAVYADNVINIEVQSATADAVEYTVTSKADNTMNLLIYECFYDYSGRYAIMSNKSVTIAENETQQLLAQNTFTGKSTCKIIVLTEDGIPLSDAETDSIAGDEIDAGGALISIGGYGDTLDDNSLNITLDVNSAIAKFYGQITTDSSFYFIELLRNDSEVVYIDCTDFGGAFYGNIDMSKLSGGKYTLNLCDDFGNRITNEFNFFTQAELNAFFNQIASGAVKDTVMFKSELEKYGLFTDTLKEIYDYYNNTVYEEYVLKRINTNDYGCDVQRLYNAVIEAYALSVIEQCSGWGEITELLDIFGEKIGLDLLKYHALTTSKKTNICKELCAINFYSISELNNAINSLIANNATSRPSTGGGGGGGGGFGGLSYDFVKKLTYTENESNELCITGIETDTPLEITDIIIPRTINGKTVTEIAGEAFENLSEVRRIAIPETVTKVARDAFSGITQLVSVYLYGNEPSIVDALQLNSYTTIYCYDSSEIYTYAKSVGCNVLPIYEYSVTFKREEDSYISAAVTDNRDDFTTSARLYIRNSDRSYELNIFDTNTEATYFEIDASTEIFVYEERTGDFNRVNSIPGVISGTDDDSIKYSYQIENFIYNPANRQIHIKPYNNEHTNTDATDEVLILFFDETSGSRSLLDFQRIVSKCGEEIIYNLPKLNSSGSYFIETRTNGINYYLLNEEDTQELLDELKSGVTEPSRIREIVENLRFASEPDYLNLCFGNLNESGILALGESFKETSATLESMYNIFYEKAFLLALYEPYTYCDAVAVGDILRDVISADYDLLSDEDVTALFESIYKTSFNSRNELQKYISEYILKKQTFKVTFVDYNGEIISEQNVNGMDGAQKPSVSGTIKVDDRTYIFDGWDRDFSSITEDITVKAIYIPQYYAMFMVDGKLYRAIEFTSKNPIPEITVPEKTGYIGEWEPFEQGEADLMINAVYTPIEYELTFVADGRVVKTVPFTIESTDVDIPDVPLKEGYLGKWNEFEINEDFILAGNFAVNAVYISTKCGLLHVNGNKVNGTSITLPDYTDEILTLKYAIDEKATAEVIADKDINGNVILKIGNNSFIIRVTAENGVYADYTVNVYRLSDECELISADNGKIEGNSLILESVSYDTESIEINAEVSEKAVYELYTDEKLLQQTDRINLETGENKAWLKVIAENGKYTVYTVTIKRRERLSAVESSMVSGYYVAGMSDIELSHPDSNAVIYYTTDGSIPDINSAIYTDAIPFDEDVTVSAVAMREGYDASAVQIFKYKAAKPISNTEVSQIFGNNAIVSFDAIEGAEEIRVIAKYSDSSMYVTEVKVNESNTAALVSGLTPHVYTMLIIEVVYPNGVMSAQTEWFMTETEITSECEIIHMSDPNAVVDNDTLTITNMKVSNKNSEMKLEAFVSNGATYAVYPSRYSNLAYAENIVPLKVGKNVFFIKVTASDKVTKKVYKLTVYRNTKADLPLISIENGIAKITAADGVRILYTTDNSVPNLMTGIEYTVPFEVCDGMVIRAIAVDDAKDEVSDEAILVVQIKTEKYILDLIDIQETDAYNEYSINIVCNNTASPKDAMLIFAEYNQNGEFLSLSNYKITINDTDTIINKKINKTQRESYFRIFLWETLENCMPLSKSI